MTTLSVSTPVEVASSQPAVAWGPIFAGAFAAAAATVTLMLLGSGLGLTMVSPWGGQNPTLTTFAVSTAIWLVIVQWFSSAIGGYLAGRLRTKWTGLHTDEVFFRDTAHGFMAWATATLLVVAVVAFHSMVILGAGTQVAANVAGGVASGASQNASGGTGNEVTGYLADSLLRPNDPARLMPPAGADTDRTANAEITRIIGVGAMQGEIRKEDHDYLVMLVAARTGLPNDEAQKRVDSVLAQAEEMKTKLQASADQARKASATAAILGALSLVIGAFIASVAGAMGGRQRDEDEERWAVL
jgi:hypothetical protein